MTPTDTTLTSRVHQAYRRVRRRAGATVRRLRAAREDRAAKKADPAPTHADFARLTDAVDRLTEALAQLDAPAGHDGPGMNLPGMVGSDVNPYEQELWRYESEFALTLEQLAAQLPEVTTRHLDLDRAEYLTFLEDHLPTHNKIGKSVEHKKKLELFISYHHLRPIGSSRVLDAAGGGFSWIGNVPAARRYLQDLKVRKSVRDRVGSETEYIESSLTHIPLPDESIDAISCHHAFEHFQGDADREFIAEVQRVLADGGRAVIVPLFISKDHLEMTNLAGFDNWTGGENARHVFDPTATLPGKQSGNFARIYDVAAFQRRVLDQIDLRRFSVEIVEHTLGGSPVPNPKVYARHKVSNFNFPYRALVITKASAAG